MSHDATAKYGVEAASIFDHVKRTFEDHPQQYINYNVAVYKMNKDCHSLHGGYPLKVPPFFQKVPFLPMYPHFERPSLVNWIGF